MSPNASPVPVGRFGLCLGLRSLAGIADRPHVLQEARGNKQRLPPDYTDIADGSARAGSQRVAWSLKERQVETSYGDRKGTKPPNLDAGQILMIHTVYRNFRKRKSTV